MFRINQLEDKAYKLSSKKAFKRKYLRIAKKIMILLL